jgi:hypothetical protein
MMAITVVIRPNLVLGAAVLLGGTGLAALFTAQWQRVVALCIGFLPVLFPLWHNWYFGNVIVLFSDILTNANIYMVPPLTYWNVLGEIARLDLTGANVALIVKQLTLWLSGPSELLVMIPLHVAAIVILFRVALSANFEPMLRLTALATLALAPPAFVYLISVRYHLALWLLAAIVVAAWIKTEGLVLIDRWRPDLRNNLAQSRVVTALGRILTRLSTFAGLESSAATS